MRPNLIPYKAAAEHLLAAAEAIFSSTRPAIVSAGALLLSTLLAWFVYVPVHELLHALTCLALGGQVEVLEIAPLYGGRLLEPIVPFVRAGGGHAGRLSGFDTGGSDLVYLATDLAPYVLTIVLAFPCLRAARRRRSAVLFGVGAVLVAAPIMGLLGDFFEMGGILVSDALAAVGAVAPGAAGLQALRCDDLVALLSDFPARFPAPRAPWAAAVGAAFLVDGLLVTATLAAARWPVSGAAR